jgi:hypothetical protein
MFAVTHYRQTDRGQDFETRSGLFDTLAAAQEHVDSLFEREDVAAADVVELLHTARGVTRRRIAFHVNELFVPL